MKSIEKLVLRLIPVELLAVILHSVSTYFSATRLITHSDPTMYATITLISSLSYLLGHVVIGVWLFQEAREISTRRWVWLAFGLGSGYWSLAVFLLTRHWESGILGAGKLPIQEPSQDA